MARSPRRLISFCSYFQSPINIFQGIVWTSFSCNRYMCSSIMCTFRSSYFWKILSYSVLCRLQVLPEVQHGFELTVSRNFDMPLSQDQSMNPNRLSIAENELSKLSVFYKFGGLPSELLHINGWKIRKMLTKCSFCCRVQNIRSQPLFDHSLWNFDDLWEISWSFTWWSNITATAHLAVPNSDCTRRCFSQYRADSGLRKIDKIQTTLRSNISSLNRGLVKQSRKSFMINLKIFSERHSIWFSIFP